MSGRGHGLSIHYVHPPRSHPPPPTLLPCCRAPHCRVPLPRKQKEEILAYITARKQQRAADLEEQAKLQEAARKKREDALQHVLEESKRRLRRPPSAAVDDRARPDRSLSRGRSAGRSRSAAGGSRRLMGQAHTGRAGYGSDDSDHDLEDASDRKAGEELGCVCGCVRGWEALRWWRGAPFGVCVFLIAHQGVRACRPFVDWAL